MDFGINLEILNGAIVRRISPIIEKTALMHPRIKAVFIAYYAGING